MVDRNKRKFFKLGLIKTIFPITERLLPFLARRWGNKLFFTPVRFNPPYREIEVINTGSKFNFSLGNLKLQGYEWGEGPTILLMHGWAGRAGQFSEFINPLVISGFKVVAFDAPGHGSSEGKVTHLLAFAEAVKAIADIKGPLFAAIGHSLGGSAILLARKNGLEVEKLVTISVPSISSGIITEFLKKLNASAKIGESIRNHVQKKFNRSFDEFSAIHIVSSDFPTTDILIIHDENDREAPRYHFDELKKALPSAGSLLTKQLGHNKILRNEETIQKVINFLNTDKTEDLIRTKTNWSEGV
jgi:pimeloyl-ACP methyl ester carboxylesterase